MEDKQEWAKLTPDEKKEERFRQWLEPPNVNFISPEAEQAYHARLKRLADAYLSVKATGRL